MEIGAGLVERLVARQFPDWRGQPVRPVAAGGVDNRTFRLGEEFVARLPSAAVYAGQVEKEQRWLPRLRPALPLEIPEPVAMGAPGEGYPWNWSVYRWIEGEVARPERIADMNAFAEALAAFLLALRCADVAGGAEAGTQNFFRGCALGVYDAQVREACARLGGEVDGAQALRLWDAACAATWRGPATWLHGDVAAGNLLVRDGRLAAVIDFGCLGVGDPACDLAIAWTFPAAARERFLSALKADEAERLRAKGWVVWKALVVLAGMSKGDPVLARETLETVLTG